MSSSPTSSWFPTPSPTATPATSQILSPTSAPRIPPTESFDDMGDLQLVVGAEGADQARIAVCSRALSRASPTFQRMLYGSSTEKRPASRESNWVVSLPDEDPQNMRIIIALAHGSLEKVPASPSLQSLYQICTYIDKYDITGLLKPWAIAWCKSVKLVQDDVKSTAADHAKVIWIAWVLGNWKMVDKSARHLLYIAQSSELAPLKPLDTTGVLNRIAHSQLEIAQEVVGAVQSFWLDLVPPEKGRTHCHVEDSLRAACDMSILGSATASLSRAGFLPNKTPKIYDNFQIKGLADAAIQISREIVTVEYGSRSHKTCTPDEKLRSRIKNIVPEHLPSPARFAYESLQRRAKRIGVSYYY